MVVENIVVDMACVAVVAEHSGVELDSVRTPEMSILQDLGLLRYHVYGVGNFVCGVQCYNYGKVFMNDLAITCMFLGLIICLIRDFRIYHIDRQSSNSMSTAENSKTTAIPHLI